MKISLKRPNSVNKTKKPSYPARNKPTIFQKMKNKGRLKELSTRKEITPTQLFGKNNKKFAEKAFQRKNQKKIRLALFIATAVIILAALVPIINITVKLINDPAKKTPIANQAPTTVYGFNEIPLYPSSEFIYQNYLDQQAVKDFLSDGRAVYRIPPTSKFDEVREFYIQELPKKGWQHVGSIPLESEEKMPGEYFIKSDQGLRIYSQLNDIWYQKLTVEQAQTSLSQELASQKERDLIFSSLSGSELLPDITWELKIPPEYLVSYSTSSVKDNLKNIYLKKLNSSEFILFEPLAEIDSADPELLFEDYIKKHNEEIDSLISNEKSEKERRRLQDQKLTSNSVKFLTNERDGVYYILVSNMTDSPMIDYIASEAKVKSGEMRLPESLIKPNP